MAYNSKHLVSRSRVCALLQVSGDCPGPRLRRAWASLVGWVWSVCSLWGPGRRGHSYSTEALFRALAGSRLAVPTVWAYITSVINPLTKQVTQLSPTPKSREIQSHHGDGKGMNILEQPGIYHPSIHECSFFPYTCSKAGWEENRSYLYQLHPSLVPSWRPTYCLHRPCSVSSKAVSLSTGCHLSLLRHCKLVLWELFSSKLCSVPHPPPHSLPKIVISMDNSQRSSVTVPTEQ